jgi:hypothetical protein
VPREPKRGRGLGNNWAKARIHISLARTQMTPPRSVAAFVVNSEPTTGNVPRSVCVWGPSFLAGLISMYVYFSLLICRPRVHK